MMRKPVVAAIVVAAGLACAPSASAAHRSADLVLTVADSTDLVGRTTTLRCGPSGGGHPRAASACAALSQVDGHFDRLSVHPDRACTLQYDPVRVTATGRWRGRLVTFEQTYSNPCLLAVTAGPVFSF